MSDVNLIFSNCFRYNKPESPVASIGRNIEKTFKDLVIGKGLQVWIDRESNIEKWYRNTYRSNSNSRNEIVMIPSSIDHTSPDSENIVEMKSDHHQSDSAGNSRYHHEPSDIISNTSITDLKNTTSSSINNVEEGDDRVVDSPPLDANTLNSGLQKLTNANDITRQVRIDSDDDFNEKVTDKSEEK